MKRPFIEQAKRGKPLPERMRHRIAQQQWQAARARRDAYMREVARLVVKAFMEDLLAFAVMEVAVQRAKQSSKEGSNG